jgi:hypothetical protein
VDKSENLSQLQKDLGVLSKIQSDYSKEAISKFETKNEKKTSN